jgi:hypothetical protein
MIKMNQSTYGVNIAVTTSVSACRAIHCNVDGTYYLKRITPAAPTGAWLPYVMKAGMSYGYSCIGVANDAGSTACSAGAINFEY